VGPICQVFNPPLSSGHLLLRNPPPPVSHLPQPPSRSHGDGVLPATRFTAAASSPRRRATRRRRAFARTWCRFWPSPLAVGGAGRSSPIPVRQLADKGSLASTHCRWQACCGEEAHEVRSSSSGAAQGREGRGKV
jgi:hypothetical protein